MRVFCTLCFCLYTILGISACEQQAQLADTMRLEASQLSFVCEDAEEYVSTCVGSKLAVFGQSCDDREAQLLIDTPCKVLSAAYEVESNLKGDFDDKRSFSCLFFGLGCEVDQSCYQALSGSQLEQVLELSSTDNLGDEYDVQDRIENIAAIFRESKDPRGIFAIVYRLITNNAVESVDEGLYEHPQWTRKLIIAFARRYLENLHAHLSNEQPSPQWKKYYTLAQNCAVGYGRTLGVAIATHLMVDLPYALNDVDSVAHHEDDFILFGEVSLRIFPDLIRDMQAVYQTDVSQLLQGFFLGEWVDSIYTKGTATTFIYQTVRINAWRNSQNLLTFPQPVVHADIATGWGLAEVFLAILDATEAL